MAFALVSGVIVGAIYGLFAVGIVLVYRGSRVVNFAAPALGTFALYVAWTVTHDRDTSWWTAAILAVLASGAIALLFERLIVRRMRTAQPLAIAVATIGLMLLLTAVELLVWDPSPRFLPGPIEGSGIRVAGLVISPIQLLSIAVVAALGIGLTQFLRRTDFGLGVQAAAMDADALRLVGVPLDDVSAFVWTTGGMLAAVAALLVEPSIGAFAPGFMTQAFFVPSLAAALVGGLDDINGAFVGGIAVGVLSELTNWAFLGSSVPGVSTLVVFIVIVGVLLLAPGGLVAEVRHRLSRNLLVLAEGTSR